MFLAKWILVVALLAAGVILLIDGLGATIPFLKYKDLEAYAIPAGAVLLAAGIALATLWKIRVTGSTTTETTTEYSDGTKSTVKQQQTYDKTMRPPGV